MIVAVAAESPVNVGGGVVLEVGPGEGGVEGVALTEVGGGGVPGADPMGVVPAPGDGG